MVVITAVAPTSTQAQRAHLSCGHVVILTEGHAVGGEYICHACLYHEPRIVAYKRKEQGVTLFLSCGHNPVVETDLADDMLDTFVDTAHPCKACRKKFDAR